MAIGTASLLFLIACTKDDDKITHFSTVVNVTGASISAQKYTAHTVFSTDGGTTFVDYPKIALGQEYQVKVVDANGGDVTDATCYILDWSASNPKPTSVTNGIAAFKMAATTDLSVVVTNVLWVADAYVGAYTVVQDDWADVAVGSTLNITKIDATHLQVNGYPATDINHKDLVITIPNPVLGGGITVASQASGAYTATNGPMVTTTSGTGLSCNADPKRPDFNLSLNFAYTFTGNGATGSSAGNHLILKKK